MTLAGVSERQKISLSYLEQLFGKLRRARAGRQRARPGRRLQPRAGRRTTISVADIILAVDEPIDATQCGGTENCHDDRRCMTHDLWASLNDHIFAYLRSVTLAELVAQQQDKPTSRCCRTIAQARRPRAAQGRARADRLSRRRPNEPPP